MEVLSALSQGGKPLQQHVPLAAMLTQHVVALRPRFLVVARRLQAERDGSQVPDDAGVWMCGVCADARLHACMLMTTSLV